MTSVTRSRKVERRIRDTIQGFVMPTELTITVQAIQAHFNAGGTVYTIPYARTRVGIFDMEVTPDNKGGYRVNTVALREEATR